MSTALKPWAPTELTPDTKKRNLVDQIVKVFEKLWNADLENTRALATSTDREDSAEGSVTIDKILLAALVKKEAGEGSELANAKVGEITRVMHHATKRVGVDRVAIAARKADFLAIQGSEPVDEWPQPLMNERHDPHPGQSSE